jgi:MFS family permease
VRQLSIIGTASYTWAAVAGSFLGYALAGYLHDAIGRRRAFSLYFLGAAAAIALFTKMPVSGTMMGLSVTFLVGFFASGQAAGLGAYLAELFPTAIRATGQGFAYSVGRGLAAAAPTAVATASGSLGLANSILSSAASRQPSDSSSSGPCPKRKASRSAPKRPALQQSHAP